MSESKINIREQLAEVLGLRVDHLQGQASLSDLVQESFMLVELVIQMQEAFGVSLTQKDLQDMKTVDDLTMVIANKLEALEYADG